MPTHSEDQPPSHRGHKIVAKKNAPGGKQVWIPRLDVSADSEEQAKELIDEAIRPDDEPPHRARMGL